MFNESKISNLPHNTSNLNNKSLSNYSSLPDIQKRKYNVLTHSYLSTLNDENQLKMAQDDESRMLSKEKRSISRLMKPLAMQLPSQVNLGGYLKRLNSTGIQPDFFKRIQEPVENSTPSHKCGFQVASKKNITGKRNSRGFIPKNIFSVTNAVERPKKADQDDEEKKAEKIGKTGMSIDIDLNKEILTLRNHFEIYAKDTLITIDELLTAFIDNYVTFTGLEENSAFMAGEIRNLEGSNPILSQFLLSKNGKKFNPNVSILTLKNFVMYTGFKYLNNLPIKSLQYIINNRNTTITRKDTESSIFEKSKMTPIQEVTESTPKHTGFKSKFNSNKKDFNFLAEQLTSQKKQTISNLNIKVNNSLVASKPIVGEKTISKTGSPSKMLRKLSNVSTFKKCSIKEFDANRLSTNQDSKNSRFEKSNTNLFFKKGSLGTDSHINLPGGVRPELQSLTTIKAKRSKEIIKALYLLNEKIESYIIEKQDDHLVSLNKNLYSKLDDIEKQKVQLEKLKGKAQTGLLMKDRQTGSKVVDLLKDMDYDTDIVGYGYKVSEKMNEFEHKNGIQSGINKKVRSSSTTVGNLFFSKDF